MKVYKLTNQKFMTHKNTLWGEGVTHETSGSGPMCSSGWLHYYHDPYLAVLLNVLHAQISNPLLWEAEAEGEYRDDRGLKGACTKLTTIRQIPLPEISLEERVGFAIRCAKLTNLEEFWVKWADEWISGKNRQIDILQSMKDKTCFNNAAYLAINAEYRWRLYKTNPGVNTKYYESECIYMSAYTVSKSIDYAIEKGLNVRLIDIVKEAFPPYNPS